MTQGWRPRTQLIHGSNPRSPYGETSEALYLTSGFVYDQAEDAEARFAATDPGYMYSRVGNPTVRMFEDKMRWLEGTEEAAATATGMAAVTASLMSQLRSGDRVVAARLLFGSCHWVVSELLPRFGIDVELVDGADLEAWEQALATPTKLVFFETPGNPTLDLVDIQGVTERAHASGAKVIVDNVFATPLLQQPVTDGADMVVYSATKHIDGQGRCLGGVILCDAATRNDLVHPFLKNTGPALSPFNAWVLTKGLETLELRVQSHVTNAQRVAEFLEDHPKVAQVHFPGLKSHPQFALARRQMSGPGSLLAFTLHGGKEEAFAVMNRLRLVRLSNNLGDAKSMVTHPATTTHSKVPPEERADLGITDNLIRLSVGLEDPFDLLEDLDQALTAAPAGRLRTTSSAA